MGCTIFCRGHFELKWAVQFFGEEISDIKGSFFGKRCSESTDLDQKDVLYGE